MSSSYGRIAQRPGATLRVEHLLDRYPALDEREVDELIELLPRLNLIEQGLISADPRLSVRMDAFRRDHASRLRPPMLGLVLLLIFPLLIAIFLFGWMVV